MKKCKVVFSTEDSVVSALQERNRNYIFRARFSERGGDVLGFKAYSYLSPVEGLCPGDMVVVESKYNFSLATFVCYDPITPKGLKLKMVIGKVDMQVFLELKQAERRKEELLSLMGEKRKALEETLVLEMLAEKDTDMRLMLDEYKMLQGTK
jgi:hypothetical protein